MTNGEHDRLWINAFNSVPKSCEELKSIAQSLRCLNGLIIAKELFALGELSSKEVYIDFMKEVARDQGFETQ